MQLAKYSASGNDFVIFHTFLEVDRSDLAKKVCHRQNGVGADGLIVLLPSDSKEKYDFKWQFYNSDGSLAEMCGNGSRATAHYAYINALAKDEMKFLTLAGIIEARVEGDVVESALTKPKYLKKDIRRFGLDWELIDTGVPHLVAFVDDLNLFDKAKAKELREEFNANVNFAKIEDKKLFVRTYERGVEDETLACGTGMAACFLKAYNEKKVDEVCEVYPKSKEKLILSYKNNKIYFKGKVTKVFDIIEYNII